MPGTIRPRLARFNDIGTLSQTVAVLPGGVYALSFYLSNFFSDPPHSFSVQLGTSSFSLPADFIDFPYGQFSLNTVAAGPTLTVTFSFFNEPGFWLLDDVALVGPPVPEPATWALMLGGMGALASLARRHRRASA